MNIAEDVKAHNIPIKVFEEALQKFYNDQKNREAQKIVDLLKEKLDEFSKEAEHEDSKREDYITMTQFRAVLGTLGYQYQPNEVTAFK